MRAVLALALFIGAAAQAEAADGPMCPGPDMADARAAPPVGRLIIKSDNQHNVIWLSPSGRNSGRASDDPACHQLSECQPAGGFGKFIAAVSGSCQEKHFDSYFGLDGITFGIEDWTADNLPKVLAEYRLVAPAEYAKNFNAVGIPTAKNGCVDPGWVADQNRSANLYSYSAFPPAFRAAVQSVSFQRAELQLALKDYESRIAKMQRSGFKTTYGLVAMATIMNNLKRKPQCHMANLIASCAAQPEEYAKTECVLSNYAKNVCRGGHEDASLKRVAQIHAAFPNRQVNVALHPNLTTVQACIVDPTAAPSPSMGRR